MLAYIVRRLLLMIPTLLGITALVFFSMALSPGGVGGPLLTELETMKPQERAAMEKYYNERYGLLDPPIVQYGRWLNQISPIGFSTEEVRRTADDGAQTVEKVSTFGFKAPDLGESFNRRRPVVDVVLEALPITILLNAITIPVIYAIGIFSGIFAARHRGKLFDVGWSVFSLGMWALPVMWVGVLLIGFMANRNYLHWFPTGGLHDLQADSMPFLPAFTDDGWQRGWLLDMAWHLVLPIICLSYGGFAFLSKLVRGSVLDQLHSDYVRTVRAKGVDEKTILYTHVFRNSLLPLITVASGILPALLAGAFVVETIFSIPGMGKLGVDAVKMRDRELVLAVTLVGGMIGLLSELVRDVCYAIADPRVSYE